MYFRFITSTPLNIFRGSGTFAGISTLAQFLRASGETVDIVTPTLKFALYTLERLVFNEALRLRHPVPGTVTVGFDMDGYALTAVRQGLHIASIKGVIADEMRFEAGLTKATMRIQAACEKRHVQIADAVFATSRYSAERIQHLYAISQQPHIIPEPIDLAAWRKLLERNPAQPADGKFIVLSVCRFYPRKRLHILLGAADRLRSKMPDLEVRIVGDGPEAHRTKRGTPTMGGTVIVIASVLGYFAGHLLTGGLDAIAGFGQIFFANQVRQELILNLDFANRVVGDLLGDRRHHCDLGPFPLHFLAGRSDHA